MMKIAAPTHQGDSGVCIACREGTDSGIGLQGQAEFIVSAISRITGDSFEVAEETYRSMTGCAQGRVPAGDQKAIIRLCGQCAAGVGFPIAPTRLADGAAVPTYGYRT